MSTQEMKEKNKRKILEFMESNETFLTLQENDNRVYVMLKRPLEYANLTALYLQSFYSHRTDDLKENFEFEGVYHHTDREFYFTSYNLSNLLDEHNNLRSYVHLEACLIDEVNKTVEEILGNGINNLNLDKAIFTEDELKNYKEERSRIYQRDAEHLFLKHMLPEEVTFKSFYAHDNVGFRDVLRYIVDPKAIIKDKAKTFLEEYKEQIYKKFIDTQCVKEYLQEIYEDSSKPIFYTRAISEAVKGGDFKTVNVTILKKNTPFTFKVEASSLITHYPTYSTWYILAKDRAKFKALYGNEDYTCEEIQKITHGKKVLYEKAKAIK